MHTQSIPFCEQSSGSALEIAIAAHDLRNRVGIAGCEVHLLRRRIAAEGHGRVASEYLASIERALRAATDRLEPLLELMGPHVKLKCTPEPPELDLVQLVTRVVEQHRVTSGAHELTFITALPHITGAWDEDRLSDALGRLLTNAITYSPASGEVVVTLRIEGSEVLLRVADDGIGIPATDLPHIFRPFYRAHNAESTCAGLGLGLAAARLTVEQYGGVIEAESVEGHGATFTLRLPLPTPQSGRGCAGPADRERAPRGRAPLRD